MTFKPSRFDHDYSLAVLGQLTVTERVTHDADVARLNEVAGAWACNDPAPGSKKSFEKAYYSIGRTLRNRGASYPAI